MSVSGKASWRPASSCRRVRLSSASARWRRIASLCPRSSARRSSVRTPWGARNRSCPSCAHRTTPSRAYPASSSVMFTALRFRCRSRRWRRVLVISAPSAAMVGAARSLRIGMAAPNRRSIAATRRIADRLSPPTVKKLAWRSRTGPGSQASHSSARAVSTSPRGGSAPADGVVPRGQQDQRVAVDLAVGGQRQRGQQQQAGGHGVGGQALPSQRWSRR